MLINFENNEYWSGSLGMLATKHCCDMIANTVDLMALSKKKIEVMRCRMPFDLLSIALIITVQVKLFRADEDLSMITLNSQLQEEKVRLWIVMEVGLFYFGLLVQGLFFATIYTTVRSEEFVHEYLNSMQDEADVQEF